MSATSSSGAACKTDMEGPASESEPDPAAFLGPGDGYGRRGGDACEEGEATGGVIAAFEGEAGGAGFEGEAEGFEGEAEGAGFEGVS